MSLGKKIKEMEQTTGKLVESINSMSSELREFKSETKDLTDQVKLLNDGIGKLGKIFETQLGTLAESLQTLGQNLTQNVVDNILKIPKMFTKKRDPHPSNSK